MASKAKWLIGCGLGCAGLVVVVIVLGVVVTSSLVREAASGFEAAVQTNEELRTRAAEQAPFVPTPDGRIAAEDLERFLTVREATRLPRQRIEKFFEELPTTREEAEALDSRPAMEKLGMIFGLTRSAVGFGRDLGELLGSRNQALLDVGMGFDEYTYLYAVVYGAWLGHGLSGGPRIDGEARDLTSNDVLDRVGDMLRGMLADQLAAADAAGVPDAWRTTLAEEVARLDADHRALPWDQGLPEALAASLEPFRERLTAEFSPATNAMELGTAHKRRPFSFDLE